MIDDPSARDVYARYILLQAILEMEFGTGNLPTGTSVFGIESTATPPPVSTVSTTLFHPALTYLSSGWPLAYLIATVVLGIGLLIGAITQVSPTAQLADKSSQNSDQRLASAPAIRSVGRVTGMIDCQFSDQSTVTFSGAHVSLGRRYAIVSGLMEVTYDTGAKVILQGPCDYEVTGAESGHLSIGRLTARVDKRHRDGDKESVGVLNEHSTLNDAGSPGRSHLTLPSPMSRPLFIVATPTATVTDLGTEFGVEVDRKGATDAKVFIGKVRIESIGNRSDSGRQSQMLTSGESVHVAVDLTLSPCNGDFEEHAKEFVRVMPTRTSEADVYAHMVLSMNPVVYYRMDQWPTTEKKNEYTILDSAPGGHNGLLHVDEAFGKPSSKGKFGGVLELHGSGSDEYAFVKSYPRSNTGKLSVSAWVWATTLDVWAGIVGNTFSPSTPSPALGQFGFGISRDLELEVRVRHSEQPHPIDISVCDRGTPFPRNQWQHVAFVADGATLRLYRNGVEVGVATCRGVACPQLPEWLSIGCQMDRDGTRLRPGEAFVWNGMIDELAVFNHALTLDQVRRLYTGNPDRKSEDKQK